MGRRTVLEVGAALLVGALLGGGAHAWFSPAGAMAGAPAQVQGASLDRSVVVPDGLRSASGAAVVRVDTVGCGERRQGSATLVRDRAGRELLLTNAHVVRGAGSASVTLDGAHIDVAVLGTVVGRDAALLDPRPVLDAGGVAAAVGVAVGPGDPVVVVGHPFGGFRVDGARVDQLDRRAAYGSASDVLLVGATADGGHSGGAVMDPSGAVVGLVAARDPATDRVVAYQIGDVLGEARGGVPSC